MEYIGWILGWPLRLLGCVQWGDGKTNFAVSLLFFLLFWKVMLSVSDCFAQKRAARTDICSRMLEKCRQSLYAKSPEAYEQCGLKIYDITKTGALTSFWNFLIPLAFIYLLVYVLYHPLTYFFGVSTGDLSATFGTADQIEIIRSILSGQYTGGVCQSELFVKMSQCTYGYGGVSVVDLVSIHNISIVLPIVVLLLQSKRVVMSVVSLFSKKSSASLKKRGVSLGIALFVLALSLTSAFVLPIFICLELIVWLVGSDIFAFVFKRTVGKRYRTALDQMEQDCENTISSYEKEFSKNSEQEVDNATNGEN